MTFSDALRAALRASAVVALVAACSVAPGSGGSPPPETSGARPSSSAVTASLAAPAGTAVPSPSRSPVAPLPSVECIRLTPNPEREALVSIDPDLSSQLPAGWFPMTVASYRRQAEADLSHTEDPTFKRLIEFELEAIDSGVIRGMGWGSSGPSCAAAVIGLSVYPTASTLEEAVAARLADQEAHGPPHKVESTTPVTLAVGPAMRILLTTDLSSVLPGSVPTQAILYIVLAPDRRVVTLSGTAPTMDTDFGAMVEEVARSLAFELPK
jgi:hypothetical protein